MTGEYVEIVKVSDGGHVYLSNGDVIFKDSFYRCWCVDHKKTSSYAERLLNADLNCKTFKNAVESYERRTGNCFVGPMDAEGVERILSNPGLSWVTYKSVKETV